MVFVRPNNICYSLHDLFLLISSVGSHLFFQLIRDNSINFDVSSGHIVYFQEEQRPCHQIQCAHPHRPGCVKLDITQRLRCTEYP